MVFSMGKKKTEEEEEKKRTEKAVGLLHHEEKDRSWREQNLLRWCLPLETERGVWKLAAGFEAWKSGGSRFRRGNAFGAIPRGWLINKLLKQLRLGTAAKYPCHVF